MDKNYNCMNDVMFKNIFKDKETLAFYVNRITNNDFNPNDIDEISNEIKTSISSKGVLYDISVKIDDKIYIDMEAQNIVSDSEALKRRMVNYSANLYNRAFDTGSKYVENHRTIVIFLVNDKYEKDKYYEKLMFKDQDNKEYDFQIIYKINIPKYIKNFKPKTENDKLLIEGLELLIADNYDKYQNSNNPTIRKVALEMSKLNSDEKTRLAMSMAELEKLHDRLEREAELNKAVSEAKEEGHEEGLEEGLQQGIEKELINNIKTMYSNGADIDTISKLLSLDIDFVKKVLNK